MICIINHYDMHTIIIPPLIACSIGTYVNKLVTHVSIRYLYFLAPFTGASGEFFFQKNPVDINIRGNRSTICTHISIRYTFLWYELLY